MSEQGVRLKLLMDKESKKVIYAEAGKEFVDFLMGLKQMPLGTILRLLKQSGQIGSLSLGKIYVSAQDLEGSYLQQSDIRSFVLDPNFPSNSKVKHTDVLQKMVTGGNSYYYSSNKGFSYDSRDAVDGYVKGATSYMIMDDLTIKPSSTISSISVFNTQGIKDMGTLQERIVQVDSKKALELVRAAFQSSTVLTDVFICKDEKKTAKPTA